MLFPFFSSPVMHAADSGATSAAIKCLLAYTHGLEDCQIDVEIVDGVMTLTGSASSEGAARHATAIAAHFTSKQVACGVRVIASTSPHIQNSRETIE